MINVVCGIRSTGRICTDLALELEARGHEVKIAYGRETVPEQFRRFAIRIGNDWDVRLHGLKARLWDGCGFGSKKATKRFIEWIKIYNPDVIHLHNIHGYYINIEELFNYLRSSKKRIMWTLHDCWAFTGHCTYFEYINCNRWQYECRQCPQKKEYPACNLVSRANYNYRMKKKLFTGIERLQIITPSNWLKDMVKQSYLKGYPVMTIHNGVDTNIFRYTPSTIREKYNLNDKKIILGVASIWDKRKGLKYLVQLSKRLNENYQVVVIGISEKQKRRLPQNILGILRTDSIFELVAWYSAADFFVNPTLEDNYPTTNLEAIACGVPVISFDTGGSVESIPKDNVVPKRDIDGVISLITDNRAIKSNICVDKNKLFKKYMELYENEIAIYDKCSLTI